ncbi:hypothetical protein B0A48_03130 [Cryoendolithus antarcticus]|uniref:Nucleoporin POM152 n=1 Tax=Cryoendolithus antarcticus TaxID=1507870 RepID=A0A1V8TMM1_9PEZI|nr:hypothetical protein B0A48_03130 [Cryoendolithus antarcticus]
MDGTPRARSGIGAFPATPQRRSPYNAASSFQRNAIPSLDTLKSTVQQATQQPSNEPLIPTEWIDAPTQRFYACAVYLALFSWRAWDWNTLQDSEEQSLWLFMKWVFIDGTFLFGLPAMRIPWLEWDSVVMLLLFLAHSVLDAVMMFQLPIPIGAGFAMVGRGIWGAYEMAVNERNVNPQTVLFNDSLILGRQIIHILPEGSAVLNMEREAFCIDVTRPEVRLPITINSTNPTSIDLLRLDLDTQANETIHISKSQIKTMHKDAARLLSYSDKPNEPKTLYHTVRKPGLYVLQKVIDESNLEVSRKRLAHTVVVPCPKASIKQISANKCKGELVNAEFEVIGTPPLRVKYRRTVNQVITETSSESIQPADFFSPLAKQDQSALVVPNRVDTEWARARMMHVPLTEHLGTAGNWVLSIDEVQDGFGNKVTYSEREQEKQEKKPAKSPHLHQIVTVHERPTVQLEGCTSQKPLKIAKGKAAELPIRFGSTGRGPIKDAAHTLEYIFTPDASLSLAGDHTGEPQRKMIPVKNINDQPQIKVPGLYTLQSVSTEFCQGEVMEPASCLLQNPPEPGLSVATEAIADKCAGSPIGLRVDLDLVGTPPFEVTYKMFKGGERHHMTLKERVNGHRGQMTLTPRHAGHYTYEFSEISDAVYKQQTLSGNGMRFEQDVKPSASANFANVQDKQISCIDEAVSFDVALQGEGPFKIEYEIQHAGRREKYSIDNVEGGSARLSTPMLSDGGEYIVALATITDGLGCKEFLKDEARISVRHQKPKAGFGAIEGQRSIETLEGKKTDLPVRLSGEAPWDVEYVDPEGRTQRFRAQRPNDRITVSQPGSYELRGVRDAICPGEIDVPTSKFDISTTSRPQMRLAASSSVQENGGTFEKHEVCEGEEDAVELLFKGAPPYLVQYVQRGKPLRGTVAPKNKDLRAALNVASLRLDTAQAGTYNYEFEKLGDSNYDHSARHFTPLTLRQTVHPKPTASFKNPGKTYSFCSTESAGEEVIPISLTGSPPFTLEVEIKHLGSIKPETVVLSDIQGTTTSLRIPHNNLHLGKSSIALRRVSDSLSCHRTLDSSTPRVQISVHDAPAIKSLETQTDYCVGDRLNFALTGVAPFNVLYTFDNAARKASASSATFRRLAEKPGTFSITSLTDAASSCNTNINITKLIHPLPSVRVSRGKESYIDIHEGSEAEILFEFGGTPPFEFTYTRSSNSVKGAKGSGTVLDMKSEVSEEYSMRIAAHEEGTYEVVAIKDRYCSYARPGVKVGGKGGGQKMLGY